VRRRLVTIIYSPAGRGHLSAARSIAAAIEEAAPAVDVEVIDVLRFAPRAFRYDVAWRLIQRHGAGFWDWLFDVTDRPAPALVRSLREWINARLLRRLADELQRRQPDHVVCTHFLPAVAVARLARAERLQGRASVVVTDYLSHEAWLYPGIARYYVATDTVRRALVARGVSQAAVVASGIPVAGDMAAARRPLSLASGERLRALFLAPGVPPGLLHAALASVSPETAVDLEIVAGDDAGLAQQLRRWVAALGLRANVHGLLPTLRPLIDDAHVVVTKAGGLVVSECFARGRALIFPWPAPGHERGNRSHAIDAGAALGLDDARLLGATLAELAPRPARVTALGRAAAAAAAPDAASRIAHDLIGSVNP
jgi:processive 1,2-diacylglycerol beta-glucosyltransferase